MQAAADLDAYTADPSGSYLVMASSLAFCFRPTLWGFALWGRPSEAELKKLVPVLALELADGVAPHASLIDVRRLEAADPRAFAVLSKYLRANWDIFKTRVTRLALVRPAGLLGATVAGFYQVAGAPYPVQVFDDLTAAAAWLRARELGTALDAALAGASAVPAVVLALRGWLDTHLGDQSVTRAARAMGRAVRSLQRDLGAAGTTYHAELDAARIRLAQRLLRDSDSTLTEIAYDVGCASPQHFSTLFRRVTGQTPSAYRKQT
jgi:AraC-like DNA-binding protein